MPLYKITKVVEAPSLALAVQGEMWDETGEGEREPKVLELTAEEMK